MNTKQNTTKQNNTKQNNTKQKYKFIKFQNIYDESSILYALEKDGVERNIDGVRFIEATPDFERAQLIRADSLKPIGSVIKEY